MPLRDRFVKLPIELLEPVRSWFNVPVQVSDVEGVMVGACTFVESASTDFCRLDSSAVSLAGDD